MTCQRMFTLGAMALALAIATPAIRAEQSPRETKVAAPASPVNINTALAGELEHLPGIGPAMAARIVEYRQKNGPFKKIEELMNVRGIGEKAFLTLKPQITISATKAAER
jgi:comEA protein